VQPLSLKQSVLHAFAATGLARGAAGFPVFRYVTPRRITTSANSTVTCLYSAAVPDTAIGDPHASQNFALDRNSAPHALHANAAVMPVPPIPEYDYPDRPNNRALTSRERGY